MSPPLIWISVETIQLLGMESRRGDFGPGFVITQLNIVQARRCKFSKKLVEFPLSPADTVPDKGPRNDKAVE